MALGVTRPTNIHVFHYLAFIKTAYLKEMRYPYILSHRETIMIQKNEEEAIWTRFSLLSREDVEGMEVVKMDYYVYLPCNWWSFHGKEYSGFRNL